jgi:hypothetical protein
VPGAHVNSLGTNHLYVAHLTLPHPGHFAVLVRSVGEPLAASGTLIVNEKTTSFPVGAPAIASPTPTVASSHGQVSRITTHVPPDRALLRYSVAASLAAHKPFVLVFGSPGFCPNRTCGPIVDVVDSVRRGLAGSKVRFIHVEPYQDNNPGLGFDRWAKKWRIPSEPFTYLVGADGRIKAKFEGSISAGELLTAVRTKLLGA